MQSISYYSYPDKYQRTIFACNRESNELHLLVNCAGATVAKWPLQTVNPTGRNDYYFLYLKKGELNITINNTIYHINDGTLLIIPPHCPYSYQHIETKELVYYWIHFTGGTVKEILNALTLNQLPLVLSKPEISSSIDYQMTKMFDIYTKKGKYRDYELSHCLDAIFIETAKRSIESSSPQAKLSKSIKYITNNYTTDISVPDLAEMESLSVSRYMTLFKESMHTSPYQYIIKLRLTAACEMLSNSDLSITGISEILGFQSIYFFSKLFKKHIGMSPAEYKKNNASYMHIN